jgi:diguanylate cyclase (GGDEF)-like protein
VATSLFALTWQACGVGLALLVLSLASLSLADLEALAPVLPMIVAIVVVGELRPIVMTRLIGNPVSISLAFAFAALYLWGFATAALLLAGSVLLSEVLQRKPPWKMAFNVGQYTISLATAWLVMLVCGQTPSPTTPLGDVQGSDLWWIPMTWVAYHLVNLALVGGLAADGGQTWWESFTEEFWFYTIATLAVLALSPLVAIVAVASPGSWLLLPLVLLPLLAVQRTAQMSREREHQALHDPLTGLPNRVLLADRIEQALARNTRQRGRVAVLFLDVDLFKVVNDGLGHAAGDALLIELSRRLSHVVRPGDTLARFGGDEFVLVCEDVPDDQVLGIAERVAEAVRAPWEIDGRPTNVTASIGIALAPFDVSVDAETLLRDADAAMYEAKGAGRARAVVFDEGMHRKAAARLDAAFGLREALARDELRVCYQPIVDVRSGATVGLEALVRWQHPSRGLVGPDQFIPVAEDTGLIVPIGRWVLRRAVDRLALWRRRVPGADRLWVAVNLSAGQLQGGHLHDVVRGALASTGVPASSLRLEITESVVMTEGGEGVAAMTALRDLGVALAIDDFGTGYLSLSYLKRLPVTTLKIVRRFVDGLGGDDPSDVSIADAIVAMGRALGLDVVAEGVETEAQLAMLRRLGAPHAQGFLWSRPLAEEHVLDWLRDHVIAPVR